MSEIIQDTFKNVELLFSEDLNGSKPLVSYNSDSLEEFFKILEDNLENLNSESIILSFKTLLMILKIGVKNNDVSETVINSIKLYLKFVVKYSSILPMELINNFLDGINRLSSDGIKLILKNIKETQISEEFSRSLKFIYFLVQRLSVTLAFFQNKLDEKQTNESLRNIISFITIIDYSKFHYSCGIGKDISILNLYEKSFENFKKSFLNPKDKSDPRLSFYLLKIIFDQLSNLNSNPISNFEEISFFFIVGCIISSSILIQHLKSNEAYFRNQSLLKLKYFEILISIVALSIDIISIYIKPDTINLNREFLYSKIKYFVMETEELSQDTNPGYYIKLIDLLTIYSMGFIPCQIDRCAFLYRIILINKLNNLDKESQISSLIIITKRIESVLDYDMNNAYNQIFEKNIKEFIRYLLLSKCDMGFKSKLVSFLISKSISLSNCNCSSWLLEDILTILPMKIVSDDIQSIFRSSLEYISKGITSTNKMTVDYGMSLCFFVSLSEFYENNCTQASSHSYLRLKNEFTSNISIGTKIIKWITISIEMINIYVEKLSNNFEKNMCYKLFGLLRNLSQLLRSLSSHSLPKQVFSIVSSAGQKFFTVFSKSISSLNQANNDMFALLVQHIFEKSIEITFCFISLLEEHNGSSVLNETNQELYKLDNNLSQLLVSNYANDSHFIFRVNSLIRQINEKEIKPFSWSGPKSFCKPKMNLSSNLICSSFD